MKIMLSDVDGTLLSYDRKIKNEDMEAIRQWQKKGNLFGLVTGRDRKFCDRLLEPYGLKNDVLITGNGADAYLKGDHIYSDGLDAAQAKECFLYCLESADHIIPFITLEDGYHYFPIEALGEQRMGWIKKEQAHLRYFSSKDVFDSLKEGVIVPKFSIFVRNIQETDRWLERLQARFPAYNVMKTSIDYIEITQKGVDKGHALSMLIKNAPVDLESIAFVGDGSNDLPMFKALESTYVMDHADPFVQRHANTIVSNVQEAIEHELGKGKTNV